MPVRDADDRRGIHIRRGALNTNAGTETVDASKVLPVGNALV